MVEGAVVTVLALLGFDQFVNHGEVAAAAMAMLRQIARAYGV
ncbi:MULTISPECIES: hypothetical protein [unclassified Bradyrhizobium]|nr:MULTISPECIES: hypothetical protein [unclassified Bradyrhizobium]